MTKLHVHYDREGDLLEIRFGPPTVAYMRDLGDDIFERIDEKTGKVAGYTILNFRKRSSGKKQLDVSLPFTRIA